MLGPDRDRCAVGDRRARPRRPRSGARASRGAPVSGSFAANTIELNCLPRRVLSTNAPSPRSPIGRRGRTTVKWALPSGGRELSAGHRAAVRPTAPSRPACSRCSIARVDGDDLGDLGADRVGVGETRRAGARSGSHPRREVTEDLPLGPRLADARAVDLRAERDAAFGRGLGAAAALLVPRARGQQHDGLAGVDEHLARHHDVLVDAHRHAGQSVARRAAGSGSTSRKLPPLE